MYLCLKDLLWEVYKNIISIQMYEYYLVRKNICVTFCRVCLKCIYIAAVVLSGLFCLLVIAPFQRGQTDRSVPYLVVLRTKPTSKSPPRRRLEDSHLNKIGCVRSIQSLFLNERLIIYCYSARG